MINVEELLMQYKYKCVKDVSNSTMNCDYTIRSPHLYWINFKLKSTKTNYVGPAKVIRYAPSTKEVRVKLPFEISGYYGYCSDEYWIEEECVTEEICND